MWRGASQTEQNETPSASPLLLVRKAQLSALAAYCHDDGLRLVRAAVLGLDLEAALDANDLGHLVVDDGHVVLHGLVSEVHHQIEAVNIDVSRVVLNGASDGGLASEGLADDDGLGLVPGGVERGGETGRSLPRDHDVILALVCGQFGASGRGYYGSILPEEWEPAHFAVCQFATHEVEAGVS